MLRTNYLCTWAVLVLAARAFLPAQEKPSSPTVVPGEVIVKFATNSRGAELVARAAAKGALPDADLNEYVESLAKKVELPIAIKQLSSGGNVVLTLRQPELLAAFVQKLKARPNVKKAGVTPVAGATVPAIEVDFVPGSTEANALAQASTSGHDLRCIVDPLEREYGMKLDGQISPSGQLLLKPDLSALTIELAGRLAKQSDVEYAQPNFVRRMKGTTKPLRQ